jgi:hypothetical protein
LAINSGADKKVEVAAGLEPAKTGFADQRLGLFGIATPKSTNNQWQGRLDEDPCHLATFQGTNPWTKNEKNPSTRILAMGSELPTGQTFFYGFSLPTPENTSELHVQA